MTDTIETTARQLAAKVIAVPGWGDEIDEICAALTDLLPRSNAPDGAAIAARACAILREIEAEPLVLIERYSDLLPTDLRAVMLAKAVEVIRDAGTSVEEFRDEEGTPFLRLGNVEALGIPADEMDRLAEGAPAPVGPLHRVQ